MGIKLREEVVNTLFAELLNEAGFVAIPEKLDQSYLGNNKRYPDISLILDGIKVIVECRKDICKVEKLFDDARKRVDEGLAEISVALLYPNTNKDITTLDEVKEFLKSCVFEGKILYSNNGIIDEEPITKMKFDQIKEVLRRIANLAISKDALYNLVKESEIEFDSIATKLNSKNLFYNSSKIKAIIIDVLELTNFEKSVKELDLYKMLLFILFDAILMHEVICNQVKQVNSISLVKKHFKNFFAIEWNKILNIDFTPIFNIAHQIITILPSSTEVEEMLERLRDLANKVLSSGLLKKHDFLGRLYHKLLLNTIGRYYATYYTAIPSAVLLAELLFKTDNFELLTTLATNKNALEKIKIIDPACGSGTLLSSSYVALRDIYYTFFGTSRFEEFHQKMIENVVYGWDVLDYATHLTLTTLLMHNPKSQVMKSNIYTLPNGVINNEVYIGSLSYLSKDTLFGKSWTRKGVKGEESVRSFDMEVNPNSFDVVIMNPPFTRSNGFNTKFRYSPIEVKKKQTKELQKIIERYKLTGIGQAGIAALFIVLGDKLIKEGGRIGFVIPRGFLNGVSWEKLRNLLMSNYEIKFIISNHEIGSPELGVEGWNWSENTFLGEIMLIAEKSKREKETKSKETIFVNFRNKPANEIESYLISTQVINYSSKINGYLNNGIYEELRVKDNSIGSMYKVRQSELDKYGWMTPCLFADPNLNSFAINLYDELSNIGFSDLEKVALKFTVGQTTKNCLGVDRKQISDLFEKTTTTTPYSIVWNTTGQMDTISLKSKHIGYGNPKKKNSVQVFQDYSSNFLIAERFYAQTSRLVGMTTNSTNVLANMFWEIKLNDPSLIPFLLLWFNSTYGMMIYLSKSINNRGGIFNLKKEHIKHLIFPIYTEKLLVEAKEKYTSIKNLQFENLKNEFEMAKSGKGARKEIDDFFRDKFNLPDLSKYYYLLAKEPFL